MQDQSQKLDATTVELIERTVREWMKAYAIRSVSAKPGQDHDGDPVIRVEVHYDLTEEPIDTQVMARFAVALPDRLWDSGEFRFPHVRHFFDERQPLLRAKRGKR